jgi:hypothetical protein
VSAHTTIQVSREKARLYLIRAAMSMTDTALEDALDRALDDRLYRARIVSDDRGPDDDLLDYRA